MLLVHGDPLREPARDAVAAQAERERVRQLVPQGRAPVELSDRPRGGRVDGGHGPEAGAEAGQPGQAHRAHGEVGVIGIDLDPHRPLRLVAVALGQARVGLFGQGRGVGSEQVRLLAVEQDAKVLGARLAVLRERVEEVQRVLDPDVVGVALERGLEVPAAVLDRAEAELVEAEDAQPTPRAGVERHRLLRERDRLRVEAVARAELGQAVVELGRARVEGQGPALGLREGRLVALQLTRGGERGERGQ